MSLKKNFFVINFKIFDKDTLIDKRERLSLSEFDKLYKDLRKKLR